MTNERNLLELRQEMEIPSQSLSSFPIGLSGGRGGKHSWALLVLRCCDVPCLLYIHAGFRQIYCVLSCSGIRDRTAPLAKEEKEEKM